MADELKEYTKTTILEQNFLKVDGTNIGIDENSKKQGRKTFGQNVGGEIKLDGTDKSSTELVQSRKH